MNTIVNPGYLSAASGDLARIGTSLNEASTMAALPTTAIAPAAADEISAAVAQLFNALGTDFQAINAQIATAYQQFVDGLYDSAVAYVTAEVQNNALFQAFNLPAVIFRGIDQWQRDTYRGGV